MGLENFLSQSRKGRKTTLRNISPHRDTRTPTLNRLPKIVDVIRSETGGIKFLPQRKFGNRKKKMAPMSLSIVELYGCRGHMGDMTEHYALRQSVFMR